MRRSGAHMIKAALQGIVGTFDASHFPQRPVGCLRDWHAYPQHAGRKAKQFGIATIPCHEMQLRIHYADALAHVLQCRF
jgi:hypothetical protein